MRWANLFSAAQPTNQIKEKQMIVLGITAEGEVVVNDNFSGSLSEMQAAVGGYIEVALTSLPGVTAYINEEGKLQGLPLNPAATALLKYPNDDFVVGDMLILGAPDENGDDTDVPEGTLDAILEIFQSHWKITPQELEACWEVEG